MGISLDFTSCIKSLLIPIIDTAYQLRVRTETTKLKSNKPVVLNARYTIAEIIPTSASVIIKIFIKLFLRCFSNSSNADKKS